MITAAKHWLRCIPRLSAKFWYLFACWSASLLFFLFQGGKLASMLLLTVTLLSVYLAMGRFSGIAAVKGTRTLLNAEVNRAVEAGTAVSVELNLQVPGFLPIPYVIFKDELVRTRGEKTMIEASAVLNWKRQLSVRYATRPLRRGFYYFGSVECLTEDVFGLFEHKGKLNLPQSFSVLPKTVPIREWKLLDRLYKGHHHLAASKAWRETTQINGIREYHYGDRMSRIHWNATAKTGTLKSKEFDRESLPAIILALDCCKQEYKSAEHFELAVSAAASLVAYGKREQLSIGLLSVGANTVYIEPAKGAIHVREMMGHLTDVEADGSLPLQQKLQEKARIFSSGSFVVIISPQMNDAVLQSLRWLKERQTNPCHICIGDKNGNGKPGEWTEFLAHRGYRSYVVYALHELPEALGGGGI